MTKAIFFCAILLTLGLNLTANAAPPQPNKCPSAGSIISYGVSRKTIELDSLWFAARRDFAYDTNVHWSFIIGNIDATNTNDAYIKAVAALNSITLQAGPFYDSGTDKWICLYGTTAGYPAVTVTLPVFYPLDRSIVNYLQ